MSDTHLSRPSELFSAQVAKCFADVSIIFHAGDLTNASIIRAFPGKELYVVHGNMCDLSSRNRFPPVCEITISNFRIVLIHGYGYGYQNIEDRLFNDFAEADCIVYGHTHTAVCHRLGHILFINPGSFRATAPFESPGTYAILEIDQELHGQIKQIPAIP